MVPGQRIVRAPLRRAHVRRSTPPGPRTSPTPSTACCSARIRRARHKTTFRLRLCISPSATTAAPLTDSTAVTTTMNGVSLAATAFPLPRACRLSRKSTILGKSIARGTCPRTLTSLQRRLSLGRSSCLTAQSTPVSRSAVACVSLTSGWLGKTKRGACSAIFPFGLSIQARARYGLAWSPLKAGHILGASEDTTVCHWYVP